MGVADIRQARWAMPPIHTPLAVLATLLVASFPCQAQPAANLGFKVPDGFEVTLYADDALASDIFALTFDAHGRVVVAGPGYVKILHDTKGTGKADKATVFSDLPKSGAQGLCFDGDDLICIGDKAVRRLSDSKGVGQCDKVSEPWFKTARDSDHTGHNIIKGPDGWYYMICGNDTGITKDFINSPSSPVKDPRQGVLIRFTADGKRREVVADGFRNPYRFDINQFGHFFTVDADGERIYNMPYYAPTRLFDIAQGMHHGWVHPGSFHSWSRPAYWPDNVERLVEIGRGSPTGGVVYRHDAFPEKYRNGFFSACWSYGRVYFMPLKPKGSTYERGMEVFLQTTGSTGFAPTDMAVGPDGDLFISVGGRGMHGSVYRVHYKNPTPRGEVPRTPRVLDAADPLSAWSRARWMPEAKKLGKDAFVKAALDAKLPLEQRVRAVEILTELFEGVPTIDAKTICEGNGPPALKARVIWSLSRRPVDQESLLLVSKATGSKEPIVAGRAGWEALQTMPDAFALAPDILKPAWYSGFKGERRVRAAALIAAGDVGRHSFLKHQSNYLAMTLARLWINPASLDAAGVRFCLQATKGEDNLLRMQAVRLLQIACGDVALADAAVDQPFTGYVANTNPTRKRGTDISAAAGLKLLINWEDLTAWVKGNRELEMEVARLFALLELNKPGLPEWIASHWTATSSAPDDMHYLFVLARLPGKRSQEVTRQTATALNGFHLKLAAHGDRAADKLPGFIDALLERLTQFDPALPAALVADDGFGKPGIGLVGQSFMARRLPQQEKRRAVEKLLAGLKEFARTDADQAGEAWTPDLIRLIAEALPDGDSLPLLRERFGDPRLRDAIAAILAEKRQPEDRGRWLESLASTQPGVIAAAAEALLSNSREANTQKPTPPEIGKVVRGLRTVASAKADGALEKSLQSLLTAWTGETHPSADAWVQWFGKAHPNVIVPGLVSENFASFKKRLDKIAWDGGDPARGKRIFQEKNCYRCHVDAQRLGPDLTGVAQRMSIGDLFEAIVDPSKDIAPAYRSTVIETKSGKTFSGMVRYKSPQITLLQSTPDTLIQVTGDDVLRERESNVSFMPAGLLDGLDDEHLRDLYAYIKTLRKK